MVNQCDSWFMRLENFLRTSTIEIAGCRTYYYGGIVTWGKVCVML